MAIRDKILLPDEIYYLTFTILGWKNVFVNDRYTKFVYDWFEYMKREYGNIIYSYVIMPNHIHLLLKITEKSKKVPILIMNAKRFLAYAIISELEKDNYQVLLDYFQKNARIKTGAKHKVFEDRYDSLIIQNRNIFLQKLNYIHRNPCTKHWRLAETPEEYKHSSAGNYILDKGYYPVEIMEF